jgi:hypothetical protein
MFGKSSGGCDNRSRVKSAGLATQTFERAANANCRNNFIARAVHWGSDGNYADFSLTD